MHTHTHTYSSQTHTHTLAMPSMSFIECEYTPCAIQLQSQQVNLVAFHVVWNGRARGCGAAEGAERNTEAAEALEANSNNKRRARNAPKAQLEKQSTKQRFEFRSKRFHRHLLLTRWRSRYTMDLHCTGPVLQSPCHTPALPLHTACCS